MMVGKQQAESTIAERDRRDVLYTLWWNSLTTKEKWGVKYLLLYKEAKEVYGYKHSQIRRFLSAPPLLPKKHYCSVCKRDLGEWGWFRRIGTNIKWCQECYSKRED